MPHSRPFPSWIRLPFLLPFDLFLSVVFFYFLTLHADQLHFVIGGQTVRLNNLVAILLTFFLVLRPEARVFCINRKLAYGVLALSASLGLSFVCSPYKGRCFYFLGWYGMTIVCYLGLPYLLFRLFEPKKILQLYFASFLLVGLIAALQWVFSFAGFTIPFASQIIRGTLVRPNAFAYEPSYYALYMTPFVVIATLHALLQKEGDFFLFRKMTKKKLLFIHLLFLISTATSTLFSYFIFACVLAVIWATTGWRKSIPLKAKTILGGGICIAGLMAFLWVAFPDIAKQFYLKFFVQDFRSHHSFFERWAGIVNAWKIFLEHPLTGVGIGGIPTHLYDAWLKGDTSYLFLFQEDWIVDYERAIKLFEPSNVWTEVLASTGVVGAVAFLFLLYCYGQLVHQTRNDKSLDLFLRNWVFIFFVSVIVMLIVLQFNQGLLRTYIWTHFAIAFAFTECALSKTKLSFHQGPL